MKASGTAAMRQGGAVAHYDKDFFAWTQRTAALLRRGSFEGIDIEHLAGEVEDMGKRDLRELDSRMQVVLLHLLKWRVQPRKRDRSWQRTLLTQRLEMARLLSDSPSLRSKLSGRLAEDYAAAAKVAATGTGLRKDRFPLRCPFTVEQTLDETFFPD